MVTSDMAAEVEGNTNAVDVARKRAIMTEVLGKKSGRLVGFGFGPQSEKSTKSKREEEVAAELEESRARNEELQNEINELRGEKEELKKQNEEQDKRICNLESILPALRAIPELARLLGFNASSA